MVEIKALISDYITNPYPLWSNELVRRLVSDKLKNLTAPYSLTSCILKDRVAQEQTYPLLPSPIMLVLPSPDLQSFYDEHGLKPFALHESFDFAIGQVQQALDIFKATPALHDFIFDIVNSIQLLKAENSETDTSYSHPDVPFSIFISICERESIIASLRVAESILHESMHLLLTLIEGITPLIDSNSKAVYYSPWRDEERPIRGVLHGLFVFKTILAFYKIIKDDFANGDLKIFIDDRFMSIKQEMEMLSSLPQSIGLTFLGQKLASTLLLDDCII